MDSWTWEKTTKIQFCIDNKFVNDKQGRIKGDKNNAPHYTFDTDFKSWTSKL